MPLAAVKQEQITEAFRSYLRKFAVPPYANDDARHLINGFANDLGLPEDNDFTVFTPISMTRRGSTIETHDAVSETSLLHEYVDLVVQVDCYSADRLLPAIERRHTSLRVGQLTVRITSAPTASTSSTSTAFRISLLRRTRGGTSRDGRSRSTSDSSAH